jgi:hypothetical protein
MNNLGVAVHICYPSSVEGHMYEDLHLILALRKNMSPYLKNNNVKKGLRVRLKW